MSGEIKNQTDDGSLGLVRDTIHKKLAPQLDAFGVIQDSFFGACRTYSKDISSDNHLSVEQEAFALEFSLIDTIHAIGASQTHISDKLRLAHAFMVAEDNMRIEVFRELAPQATFQTYQENNALHAFDKSLRPLLRTYTKEEAMEYLVYLASDFFNADVKRFSEAVATGQDPE